MLWIDLAIIALVIAFVINARNFVSETIGTFTGNPGYWILILMILYAVFIL